MIALKLMSKKLAYSFSTAALLSAALFVSADTNEEIAERLAPVGSVCLAGECEGSSAPANNSGTVVLAQAGGRSGEEVYTTKCNACHGTGAGNAPKLGDKDAWAPRIAKGMDTLMDHVINGFTDVGMMPPKGICMDCSDDELKSAVEYMIEKSE